MIKVKKNVWRDETSIRPDLDMKRFWDCHNTNLKYAVINKPRTLMEKVDNERIDS